MRSATSTLLLFVWFIGVENVAVARSPCHVFRSAFVSSRRNLSSVSSRRNSCSIQTSHKKNGVVLQMNKSGWSARKNIKLPLLLPVGEAEDRPLIPLPSCGEVELAYTHQMTVSTAVHKLLMEHCVETSSTGNDDKYAIPTDYNQKNPVFGHLAYVKKDASGSSFVGAIGCVSEILAVARNKPSEDGTLMLEFLLPQEISNEDPDDWTVLSRGNYRFIVKKMIQTYPFPIALVDELVDGMDPNALLESEMDTQDDDDSQDESEKDSNDDGNNNSVIEYNDFDDFDFHTDSGIASTSSKVEYVDSKEEEEEEDDDDDDDDDDDNAPLFPDLDDSEVLQRLVKSITTMLQNNLAANQKSSTLLEKSIMEQYNISKKAKRANAEEKLATWQVFLAELLDIAPTKLERQYTVTMMAAELGQVSNDVRTKMLQSTDTVWRMRYVLQQIELVMSMESAKKLTEDIVTKTNEPYKDLKVGTPTLPPWAKFIKKGIQLEYYWNDEFEWCRGRVVEDPVAIGNEMIVTVEFDDGETHKLPFSADEKARWRPV